MPQGSEIFNINFQKKINCNSNTLLLGIIPFIGFKAIFDSIFSVK